MNNIPLGFFSKFVTKENILKLGYILLIYFGGPRLPFFNVVNENVGGKIFQVLISNFDFDTKNELFVLVKNKILDYDPFIKRLISTGLLAAGSLTAFYYRESILPEKILKLISWLVGKVNDAPPNWARFLMDGLKYTLTMIGVDPVYVAKIDLISELIPNSILKMFEANVVKDESGVLETMDQDEKNGNEEPMETAEPEPSNPIKDPELRKTFSTFFTNLKDGLGQDTQLNVKKIWNDPNSMILFKIFAIARVWIVSFTKQFYSALKNTILAEDKNLQANKYVAMFLGVFTAFLGTSILIYKYSGAKTSGIKSSFLTFSPIEEYIAQNKILYDDISLVNKLYMTKQYEQIKKLTKPKFTWNVNDNEDFKEFLLKLVEQREKEYKKLADTIEMVDAQRLYASFLPLQTKIYTIATFEI